jgi:DNA-directed RNA polymerase subunit omega
MAKQTKAETKAAVEVEPEEDGTPVLDSKYRLIIVAAQRSKQLQRGARPRIDMDTQRHKPTRVALEEVQQGVVSFNFTEKQ